MVARAPHASFPSFPAVAIDLDYGAGVTAWPFTPGAMAGRIRNLDWSATPLGPIAGWPQSLRTLVDMMLALPGPATILWGPTHVQIYNDGYIAIASMDQ